MCVVILIILVTDRSFVTYSSRPIATYHEDVLTYDVNGLMSICIKSLSAPPLFFGWYVDRHNEMTNDGAKLIQV